MDYFYGLLSGCSSKSLNKFQLDQNDAARVLTRTMKFDNISPFGQHYIDMPVQFRIKYKILLVTYKASNGLTPQYLSELISNKVTG